MYYIYILYIFTHKGVYGWGEGVRQTEWQVGNALVTNYVNVGPSCVYMATCFVGEGVRPATF